MSKARNLLKKFESKKISEGELDDVDLSYLFDFAEKCDSLGDAVLSQLKKLLDAGGDFEELSINPNAIKEVERSGIHKMHSTIYEIIESYNKWLKSQ